MNLSKKLLSWLLLATLVLCSILWSAQSDAQVRRPILKTATYGWRPFIYEEVIGDSKAVRGLDARLADLAFSEIGYELSYEGEISWDQLLAELKTGQKDVVISALKRPEREAYAYYSDVFRSSVNVLYVSRGTSNNYQLANVDEMLKMFQEKSFRLGIVKGYSYGQSQLDAYIKDPDYKELFIASENDQELFEALENKQIDGFLIDQIVGADLAYRRTQEGLEPIAEEYPLRISELPYYVIFSKKNKEAPALVEKFNQSITTLKQNGKYNQLVQQYLFPVLLDFTTGQKWYFLVELVGVISFAISGLVLANREGYDLFGAFVLSALPGVGGGVLRDIVAGRSTLGLMRAPIYLITVIITVLIGYFFIQLIGLWRDRQAYRLQLAEQHLEKQLDLYSLEQGNATTPATDLEKPPLRFQFKLTFNAIIELLDTLGLSTLSIIGVIVALETQSQPLWLWGPIFAAITSAGGGILRDMVRADGNNASLKGSFYPIIAIIWGFIFSVFIVWYSSQLNYYPSEIFLAVMVTICGSFLTRIIAIIYNINMPLFSYGGAKLSVKN